MLLVNNNEPRVQHGGKHRRTGPQYDRRFAQPCPLPVAVALGIAQSRVQNRDGRVEAFLETFQKLWRQPDFRHQHQTLTASGEHLTNALQVNLRLATTGHALQQVAVELADRCANSRNGTYLFRIRLQGGLAAPLADRLHRHGFDQLTRRQAAQVSAGEARCQ